MTNKRLNQWVAFTLGFYVLCILAGVVLKFSGDMFSGDIFNQLYSLFTDLIPFFIVIPVAWLGHCFARRLAFLQYLRDLWSELTRAIQKAIQYTHLPNPGWDEFSQVSSEMSYVIDKIRGPFKNVGEKRGEAEKRGERGLYPFEGVKTIYQEIENLGYGKNFDPNRAEETRRKIVGLWKRVQEQFLAEFDREEPTYYSSPYVEK